MFTGYLGFFRASFTLGYTRAALRWWIFPKAPEKGHSFRRSLPYEPARAEIRVRNYRKAPVKLEVAIVAPSAWRIEPDVLHLETPAASRALQAFQLQIPKDWRSPSPRLAIAADVVCDGKYLGQITEAVVDLVG